MNTPRTTAPEHRLGLGTACRATNISKCGAKRHEAKIQSRSGLKPTLNWEFPPFFYMISVSNVSMLFGGKILFEEVTTSFLDGRRYGLTGPNGAGKSTFMKLLSGESEPQKGTVVRPKKSGILRQDQFAFDEHRVIDTVIMGNLPLWKALEERE